MQKKIKIGVIGAGHLGKYHINHLSKHANIDFIGFFDTCLLYTSPSPRDVEESRMPSSA